MVASSTAYSRLSRKKKTNQRITNKHESGSFYEVEAVVSLDSFLYFADYNRFIFLFHFVGVVRVSPEAMCDNAREFINVLIKLKPATAKGTYIKSIYLSSTMSPGVKIDPKSIEA